LCDFRVIAPPPGPPVRVIEEYAAREEAFGEALRKGAPASNPWALLPVVRKIRFDPPRADGAAAPLEIEDYAMGYAETMQVWTVGEALTPLWLLRMSREDREATSPPSGAG
jgi:ATP-dependent Clp protease ATP-binding subunit ClpC